MRKYLAVFVIMSLLATGLVTSCSSTSEAIEEIQGGDYKKLKSVTELTTDAESALEKSYDNLKIKCEAPTEKMFPDSYERISYDYQMYSKEESITKMKLLLSAWGISCDEKDISITDSTADEVGEDILPCFQLLYTNDSIQAGMGSNGSWTFSSSEFNTHTMTDDELVKRYHLENEADTITDSYTVGNVEYAISDAIALGEEYINKLSELIPADSVRPRTVIVFRPDSLNVNKKAGDDQYVYLIYYELIKDGLPLNQNCELWCPDIPYFRSTYISVEITEPMRISRMYGKYTLHTTMEEVLQDGILPLSYALDSTSATLAQYGDYKVSSVELTYATLAWQWDKTTFYYEPWWCICVDNGDAAKLGYALDPRAVVYVNAITGETYFQSNIYGSEVGMERYFENVDENPDYPNQKWRKLNGG